MELCNLALEELNELGFNVELVIFLSLFMFVRHSRSYRHMYGTVFKLSKRFFTRSFETSNTTETNTGTKCIGGK